MEFGNEKITLNAEQELIQKAILVAQRQQTTLEAAFFCGSHAQASSKRRVGRGNEFIITLFTYGLEST